MAHAQGCASPGIVVRCVWWDFDKRHKDRWQDHRSDCGVREHDGIESHHNGLLRAHPGHWRDPVSTPRRNAPLALMMVRAE